MGYEKGNRMSYGMLLTHTYTHTSLLVTMRLIELRIKVITALEMFDCVR